MQGEAEGIVKKVAVRHGAAINPLGIYSLLEATGVLAVKPNSLTREVREGRLRVSKRLGRYYFLGEWLIEWIRRGELQPWEARCADKSETEESP